MSGLLDIRAVIEAAGGPSKLGKAVGITHSTVLGWKKVPAQHAQVVSAVTGLPLHQLRPDVFPAPREIAQTIEVAAQPSDA